MTQQIHQPPALPPRPATHDSQDWAMYRDKWRDYCQNWRTYYNRQQLSEQEIDGWQEYYSAWSLHWAGENQPWRTEPEIDKVRQTELETYRSSATPTILLGNYPFKGKVLDRADVEWLLATHDHKRGQANGNDEHRQEQHQGLDLRGAILQGANLKNLPLAYLYGGLATDEWRMATREQREAAAMHLEGANLSKADFEGAILNSGNLQKANLIDALAESVHLIAAHLEGADLSGANLSGADLREASFDETTKLRDTIISDGKRHAALLADVQWGNVPLDRVKWSQVKVLGDEHRAHQRKTSNGTGRSKNELVAEYEAAVRAYMRLALVLENQGMKDKANTFFYRAYLLQREALLKEADIWERLVELGRGIQKLLKYMTSTLNDWLTGYGYHWWKTLIIYPVVVGGFAIRYYLLAQQGKSHLTALGAVIFSLVSFHGRGFFPSNFNFDDPVTATAAIEAVVGLLIELIYGPMIVQRIRKRS